MIELLELLFCTVLCCECFTNYSEEDKNYTGISQIDNQNNLISNNDIKRE